MPFAALGTKASKWNVKKENGLAVDARGEREREREREKGQDRIGRRHGDRPMKEEAGSIGRKPM